MCMAIPDSRKKQPAKGLPPKWTFLFTRDKRYSNKGKRSYIPGLFIYHADYPKTFRSIEAALVYVPKLKTYNPNVIVEFNRHIGVKSPGMIMAERKNEIGRRDKSNGSPLSPLVTLKGKDENLSRKRSHQSPMTLEELFESRCGACVNCDKDDCRECASCLSNRSSYRQVCLQKVS